MVAFLVAVFALIVAATVIAAGARRTRSELDPAIRAFSDFRAALRPAVARLETETGATRRRRLVAERRVQNRPR